MPIPISTNGIAGIDGVVPVYQPTARWCWWNMTEIFDGTVGANRYVPKVSDYVEDTINFITYIVVSIDPVTLIAELEPIDRSISNGVITSNNALLGVGPGTQSDTYRVYYDKTTRPYSLAVDIRLKLGGTEASYVKLFKGNTQNGKVIGFMYDANGVFLTENIPLTTIAIDNHDVIAIKSVNVCYTNEDLSDGEYIVVVAYSASGVVLSKRQLLVENTSYIRSLNASQKYVTGISLKSPFLSSSDANTIEYPINVPLQSFNMIGVVNYSDGSKLELPVDGTRFNILGLERFVATVAGQTAQLVLRYALGTNETSYTGVTGDGKYEVQPYELVTINKVGSFSVKLYCYPVWIDSITGYTLKWFMYNLDREISFDVTPYIQPNVGSPVFNPLGYGVNQALSVRLNLRDVSPIFNSYIHTQNIQVLLREPGNSRQTNWSLIYEPGQPIAYGIDTNAKVELIGGSSTRVYLNNDTGTQAEWLEKLFYRAKPVYDFVRESKAPTPNYFAVVVGSNRYEYPVSAWNNPITVPAALEIDDTLFIEFFRRENNTDMLLGMSGLPIYER